MERSISEVAEWAYHGAYGNKIHVTWADGTGEWVDKHSALADALWAQAADAADPPAQAVEPIGIHRAGPAGTITDPIVAQPGPGR